MKRIYGIDFSGAKDAGGKIWISSGVKLEKCLQIDECYPASTLDGSGEELDLCLPTLRKFIAKQTDAAFGLDFPFGLPRRLVEDSDWDSFVCSFTKRFKTIGNFERAIECFKKVCYKEFGKKEIKRLTDEQAETPHSPYNLRLYRQTYYGISRLLSPLVQQKEVYVRPMQSARQGKAWLLEICPDSTLKKSLRLEKKQYSPYKKNTDECLKNREYILSTLEETGRLVINSPELRRIIIQNTKGDALDSVIAAFETYHAVENSTKPNLDASRDDYMCEGQIYVQKGR